MEVLRCLRLNNGIKRYDMYEHAFATMMDNSWKFNNLCGGYKHILALAVSNEREPTAMVHNQHDLR